MTQPERHALAILMVWIANLVIAAIWQNTPYIAVSIFGIYWYYRKFAHDK